MLLGWTGEAEVENRLIGVKQQLERDLSVGVDPVLLLRYLRLALCHAPVNLQSADNLELIMHAKEAQVP